MKSIKAAVLASVLCLASPLAFAMSVNFSFYGTIDSAVAGNVFGLDVGDTVTVSGMFDNVLTGIGVEVISFGADTGNMVEIVAGSLTLNETDDARFDVGGEFPIIHISSLGSGLTVTQFDFVSVDPSVFDASFPHGSDQFAGDMGIGPEGEHGIVGTWNFDSFTTTPKSLAEPGTLALLAIGLLAGC